MQITELTPADADATVALWRDTGLTRPWNPPRADLLRALTGSTSTVLGGFDHDRLIATVMVGHDGHRGWVYYLAVSPGERAEGVGRQMMSAAEEWLRGQGAVKIQLMVRSTNTAALGFYDRLGYEDADVQVRAKRLG